MQIMQLFDDFCGLAKLPSIFSSYFITLIPKTLNPYQISDFHPIFLSGSLYKVKCLRRGLVMVMKSIISQNQSAFIKGRFLYDGVLVVNEVVDLAKRSKRVSFLNWTLRKHMTR
jgi:hypothetical protein